jgi:hypothetical protein
MHDVEVINPERSMTNTKLHTRRLRRLVLALGAVSLSLTAACGEGGLLTRDCGDACGPQIDTNDLNDTTDTTDTNDTTDTTDTNDVSDPGESAVALELIDGPVQKSVNAAVAIEDDPSTLADVRAFCADPANEDQAPPALPLLDDVELPAYCDEQARYEQLVDACGALDVVIVAAGAAGGDGSAAAPFGSLEQAFDACGGGCHVLVGPGEYSVGDLDVPSCSFVEGAVVVDPSASVAKAVGERPHLSGSLSVGANTVLARVEVEDSYGALRAENGALISESTLIAGYEGVSASWSATGYDVCRSTIRAGYGGAGLSWESEGLRIAGSAVSACYEGVGLSWGSHDLEVVGSNVYGGYEGVGTSWGSHTVTVTDNVVVGDYAAVSIHIAGNGDEPMPSDFAVVVSGNTVDGSLPANDAGRGISVTDNQTMN